MSGQDPDLDQFLRERLQMVPGAVNYSADIQAAWQVVEYMIRRYHCELKMDMYLGITGQHWVASFYSPKECRRYEASGPTAALAICRAAREAISNLQS